MKDEEDVERVITTQLLPALLEAATCPVVQPQSRYLAYIVTAQYMARVEPQVQTLCHWLRVCCGCHMF